MGNKLLLPNLCEQTLNLVQGEALTIGFRIRDENDNPVDLTDEEFGIRIPRSDSGKVEFSNRVRTLLAAAVSTSDDTFGVVAHGFAPNSVVRLTSDGSLPTGITGGSTNYFVKYVSADLFSLAAAPDGDAIDITTSGTGTMSVTPQGGTSIPDAVDPVLGSFEVVFDESATAVLGVGTYIPFECFWGTRKLKVERMLSVIAVP